MPMLTRSHRYLLIAGISINFVITPVVHAQTRTGSSTDPGTSSARPVQTQAKQSAKGATANWPGLGDLILGSPPVTIGAVGAVLGLEAASSHMSDRKKFKLFLEHHRFDSEKWKEAGRHHYYVRVSKTSNAPRISMCNELVHKYKLQGMTNSEVEELLGTPSTTSELVSTAAEGQAPAGTTSNREWVYEAGDSRPYWRTCLTLRFEDDKVVSYSYGPVDGTASNNWTDF